MAVSKSVKRGGSSGEGSRTFGRRIAGTVYRPRPGAYGLLTREGGADLAIVRVSGGCFLPGGGVESGESFEDALRREVIEECGAEIRIGAIVCRATQILNPRVGEGVEKAGTYFACWWVGEVCRACDGDHEVIWASPRDAARMLKHPAQSWAVERWVNRMG